MTRRSRSLRAAIPGELAGLMTAVRGRPRLYSLVAALLAVLLASGALRSQAADDGAVLAGPAPRLELDLANGVVRIPCRFVNPSRVLEVFACHREGPTHETVVEFDATGPEIYEALRALGCRTASAWNITGPTDFLQTQGDRLLVEVKWTYKGRLNEYPAEGLLHDGEFAFPAFVRGFSFGARRPPGEPPEELDSRAIPDVVELTLGGTRRQSPTFSLIWHPTTSERLERWMLPPALNPEVVEDLPVLVERQVPAILVLRRLRSERDLVNYLRSVAPRRRVEDRLGLYDRLAPLAGEIDALKTELRTLATDLEARLGDDPQSPASPADRDGAQAVRQLLARGRWLVERIEANYLAMYQLQEDFKLEWMKRRGEVPEELAEEAEVLVRDGFSFEPQLARKRIDLARLDLDGAAEDSPLRAALTKEMVVLERRRDGRLAAANLRYVEARLGALEKDDAYLRELFEADRYRLKVSQRSLAAQRSLAESEAEEQRARHAGNWQAVKEAVTKRQGIARQELTIARLEESLAEVLDELRWARNDLESRLEERKRKAEEALREFTAKKLRLEREIDTERRTLAQLKG